MASKTIYLIRHGEKPKDKSLVKDEPNYPDLDQKIWSVDATDQNYKLTFDTLNGDGLKRRDELVSIFVKDPPTDPLGNARTSYNIGLIIAQKIEDHTSRRPVETVSLLASRLGSAVKFNTTIDTYDFKGVRDAVEAYSEGGDILICWEHGRLHNIAQALGVLNPPPYPDDRFDLIWTVPRDKQGSNRILTAITSEKTQAEKDAGTIENTWSQLTGKDGIGWVELDKHKNIITTIKYTAHVDKETDPTNQPIATEQWNEQMLDGKKWKNKEYWWRDESKSDDFTVPWGRTKSQGGSWREVDPDSDE